MISSKLQKKNIVMSLIPFSEKSREEKNWNLLDFKSDPDPKLDPVIPKADPRIRIRIKMKWIRNTELNYVYISPDDLVSD